MSRKLIFLYFIAFALGTLSGCSDKAQWVASKDNGLQGTYSYELKNNDGFKVVALCNSSISPAHVYIEKNGLEIKSEEDKKIKYQLNGVAFEDVENEDCRVCASKYIEFWGGLRSAKTIQVNRGSEVLAKFEIFPNKVLPDINGDENCKLAWDMDTQPFVDTKLSARSLKKGVDYTWYHDGSCKNKKTDHSETICLNPEDYEYLCKNNSGFTKMGAGTLFTLWSRDMYLFNNGGYIKGSSNWDPSAKYKCRVTGTVAGIYQGNSVEHTVTGGAVSFIVNDQGKILINHSTND